MTRKFALLLIVAVLPFSGCKKLREKVPFLKKKEVAASTPAPARVAAPPPAAAPGASHETAAAGETTAPSAPSSPTAPAAASKKPEAPAVNKNAQVICLCYHNIEDGSKMRALTIPVAEFRREMEEIKKDGFSVIPMQDFLAWRRGEKAIPNKSCIVTIDDGWVSAYNNAWPILKEFKYPFTLFIYINYVGTGGKSMSWDQLAEMRDAGVDIESHTYSHSDLKKPGNLVDKKAAEGIRKDVAALGLDGWLRKEIIGSKQVLEKQLGIKCNVFAYPFGRWTPKAVEIVKEAGYEAAFTVYGQQLHPSSQAELLGRYAVEQDKPKIFEDAMKMIGGGQSTASASGPSEPAYTQLAAVSMVTQPMDGETIGNPKPLIKANLSTLGEIDPGTVEMRISGFGPVAVKYDPATKMASYQLTQKLREPEYTVFISAKSKGKKIETKWDFKYDSTAGPSTGAPTDASALPPRATPAPAPAAPPKKR
ncbi:polysaccharide deacetylase [Chthoniobacter flavus Ellin428]|uniref:Polysaccharide deacetylase n=1 Tax=Chthoniobacter flavus Ellin428 TaxID=497964 RepID=B4D1X8_9BACT|nr:polysaccharide deacetylase family protein [Chthoniobacter flavus]EDY19740.1 polysaccharide deacetylase [Chthoniobacter flavus Ellin428]TCO92975.1 polysaccharide deacetylase [Chthoniobacter flavus]